MTINSVIVPVSSIRTQSTLSGLAGSNASFVFPLTNDCSKDFSMSVGQDRSKSMDPVHLLMHTLVSLVLGLGDSTAVSKSGSLLLRNVYSEDRAYISASLKTH